MKRIKKFNESVLGDNDTVHIEISRNEYKLLESILDESYERRGRMTCNDAYENEEKLFSEEEHKKICQFLEGNNFCDEVEYLSNDAYVWYMIKRLEEEFKNNNIE